MTSTALTPRQARFVLYYTTHLNASRAARESGYSASSGADAVTANRLLRNNKVKTAISTLQHAKAEEFELTRQGVITAVLGAIKMAQEQGAPAVMIRGWVQIAKLSGFYEPDVVKVPLSAEGERLKQKYEAMSDNELLEILAGN